VVDALLAGGFTSVLIDDLRVNKGLVYSVNMARNRLSAPSPYAVVTSTKASSTAATIQGVLDGLHRIRTGEITEDQVKTARNLVAGRFPQQLEGHAHLATFLYEAERLALGENPQQQLVRRIRAVDTAAVDAAASCFDPDHVLIVVVGDAKHVDQQALKQFEK
jgi:zinc protease